MNNFVSDPLAHYNNHAGDVIIPALSNYYNVNVVVLQANETKCWTDYTGYKTMNWIHFISAKVCLITACVLVIEILYTLQHLHQL